MNWSNYIIMQWLPTYMARNLGADKHDIMFTAIPYLLNSLIGVRKLLHTLMRVASDLCH